MSWLRRHKTIVGACVVIACGLTAIGALAPRERVLTADWRRGELCTLVPHPRRAYAVERRRHSRWTTYQLYVATHHCQWEPWGY